MYTDEGIKNLDFLLPTILFTDSENTSSIEDGFEPNLLQMVYLLNSGYINFIFDYGTDYGYYAFKQIKKLKKYYSFNIISLKRIGASRPKSNQPTVLLEAASCDFCLGAVNSTHYISLIRKCSCISTPDGLIPMNGKIPAFFLRKTEIREE